MTDSASIHAMDTAPSGTPQPPRWNTPRMKVPRRAASILWAGPGAARTAVRACVRAAHAARVARRECSAWRAVRDVRLDAAHAARHARGARAGARLPSQGARERKVRRRNACGTGGARAVQSCGTHQSAMGTA
jgi:hypothetical protein